MLKNRRIYFFYKNGVGLEGMCMQILTVSNHVHDKNIRQKKLEAYISLYLVIKYIF